MSGFTPDEKLRLAQLRALRRQWLKDQELSPREPVLAKQKAGFWDTFLKTDSLWRRLTFKTYRSGMFLFINFLIPAWIVHYYIKYHVETRPYGIVEKKPKIFPKLIRLSTKGGVIVVLIVREMKSQIPEGDKILETGEVIPPMKDFDMHDYHLKSS